MIIKNMQVLFKNSQYFKINNKKDYIKKASQINKNNLILRCLFIFLLTYILLPAKAYASTAVGGRISQDTTWTMSGSPYIVTTTVVVYGDTINAVTLTIEPGVEMRFSNGTGIQIGSGANKGILRAVGTDTEKIIFTANTTTPTRGYWNKIHIDDGA
ncbi:MAG: hypothetical protein HY934_09740, partial [Candidatus Firestonebacteria bacterium]|nr:hypothetical protein [Candidatus Firestonebacteria bacterium]